MALVKSTRSPFKMKMKSPSVIIVKGKVSTSNMGRSTALMSPSTRAVRSAVPTV
jgi:hypothetical protein